eukprot:TRINITY_DN3272_c0_g1_i1.p1 TRINITY_DN3272_c0_g1~~TRINITY_DN3272_c0_g1_i1.p1  ORF type:complete len:944 (-),score=159.73 TRINITY_DN3272_c0_g1_i1:182-3013(-)
MNKMQFVLMSWMVCLLGLSESKTYYFSSSKGSDNNDCISIQTPCYSINKVNTITPTLTAGDSIFFLKGDTFGGQINLNNLKGTQNSTIVFSSYGNGTADPIISGLTQVTGWTKISDTVYTTKLTNITSVSNVFVNSTKISWGRTPNLDQPIQTRYFTIVDATSKSVITNQVNDTTGTWNNAVMRVRMFLWSFHTTTVSNYVFNGTHGIFNVTNAFADGYVPTPGWKFYLENLPICVDEPNEWAFTNSILYYYPPLNVDPSTQFIQASVYNYGIQITGQSSYITISNLTFFGQATSGVYHTSTSNGLLIDRCTFIDQERTGVTLNGQPSFATISNSYFQGMQAQGIVGTGGTSLFVFNNTITEVGLIQGHQTEGGGSGMSITINNATISSNTVYNIGYNPIALANSENVLIEKNHVYLGTQTLSDGGGIYVWGPQMIATTVRSNIVHTIFSPPNDGSWPSNEGTINRGIYLDNWCSNGKVYENTVFDTEGSSFFTNSYNHTWWNNLAVSGAGEGILYPNEMTGNVVVGNLYENNVLYTKKLEGIFIQENSAVQQSTSKMATYRNNTYCDLYGSPFFRYNNLDIQPFNNWLAQGRDYKPQFCPISETHHFYSAGRITNEGAIMNKNPYFQNDVSSWGCSKCSISWVKNNVTGLGQAKIVIANGTTGQVQIQQYGLFINKGSYYHLQFKASSSSELVIQTGVQLGDAPWTNPGGSSAWVLENNVTLFNWVFQSSFTNSCGINLSIFPNGNAYTLYFDELSLTPVNVTPVTWEFVAYNANPSTQTIDIPSNTSFIDINGNGPFTCNVVLGPYESRLLVYNADNDPDLCKDVIQSTTSTTTEQSTTTTSSTSGTTTTTAGSITTTSSNASTGSTTSTTQQTSTTTTKADSSSTTTTSSNASTGSTTSTTQQTSTTTKADPSESGSNPLIITPNVLFCTLLTLFALGLY